MAEILEEDKQKQNYLMSLEEFTESRLKLLEEERVEELETTKKLRENVPTSRLLDRKLILCRLTPTTVRSSMDDELFRLVVTFAPSKRSTTLKMEKFSQGDIVGLINPDLSTQILHTGVISSLDEASVTVYFSRIQNFEEKATYHLVRISNEITYKRLKTLLNRMSSYTTGISTSLFSLFFIPISSSPIPKTTSRPEWRNTLLTSVILDESQREALQFALNQPHLALIHGPPGTGKTTTVVELICQLAAQGSKMVVCAPSNVAVDHLVEKLAPYALVSGKQKLNCAVRMVRLGHPARLSPTVIQHSLEQMVAFSDGFPILQDIRKEIERLDSCGSTRRYEVGRLRKELSMRRLKLEQQCLQWANVVLCTLTGAAPETLFSRIGEETFDLVIIDEASQAIEPVCWMPMVHVNKCILVGDPYQLPPTIVSKKAQEGGLEMTLMERALALHGDGVKKTLTTQYRMHQDIMEWPSHKFYRGQLKAHPSVKVALLKDLPNMRTNRLTSTPLLFVDTCGQCPENAFDVEEESKGNQGEVDIVTNMTKYLLFSGLEPSQLGIIAPYSEQVRLIKAGMVDVEVKTIDGFQGREKEAIIVSLVRSNKNGELGFLSDARRLNVALTRAKRHLCVVGDSVTLSRNAVYRSFLNFVESNGVACPIKCLAKEYLEDKEMVPVAPPEHRHASKKRSSSTLGTSDHMPHTETSKDKPPAVTAAAKKPTNPANNLKKMEQKVKRSLHRLKRSKEHHHKYSIPVEQSNKDIVSLLMELTQKFGLTLSITEDKYVVSKRPEGSSEESASSSLQKPAADPFSQGDSGLINTPSLTAHISNSPTPQNRQCYSIQDFLGRSSSSSSSSSFGSDDNTSVHENDSVDTGSYSESQSGGTSTTASSFNSWSRQVSSPAPPAMGKKPKEEMANKKASLASGQQCQFSRCTASVQSLGLVCSHCSHSFCTRHHLPEVHGCGDAARRAARNAFTSSSTGSSTSSTVLRNNLRSKLTDMASKRKGKKK